MLRRWKPRSAHSEPDDRRDPPPAAHPVDGPYADDSRADLVRTAPVGYFTLGRTGIIRDLNEAGADLLGRDRRELTGRSFSRFVERRHRPEFHGMLQRVILDRITQNCELEMTAEPDLSRFVRIEAGPGAEGGCRAVTVDLTERRRMEQELRVAASVYQAISEAVMITDASGRIIAVNPAFTHLTGYPATDAVGRTSRLLELPDREDPGVLQERDRALASSGQWRGEHWSRRRNGDPYLASISIHTVYDETGRILHRIVLLRDVTDQRRAAEAMWRQANYDSLTGLPNRLLFEDRLRQGIRQAGRSRRSLALFFVDLDGFKEVNDTLGHAAGDGVLVEAARRISACVRDTDTTARLAGDEFTVIMSDLEDTTRVAGVARQVLVSLAEPFLVDDTPVHLSGSLGIALFPENGLEADDLLRRADRAMYAAKAAGPGHVSFASDLEDKDPAPGREVGGGTLARRALSRLAAPRGSQREGHRA